MAGNAGSLAWLLQLGDGRRNSSTVRIRWPGRIPAGRVSNDVVHEVDLFPTIAAAVGAPGLVPADRIIDGVNQLPFRGKEARSSRESALFLAREGHVMAVKWHNWKLWYLFLDRAGAGIEQPGSTVRPGRRSQGGDRRQGFYPWVISAIDGVVAKYEVLLVQHPRVPGDAADPYMPPPPVGSGSPVATYTRADRRNPGPRSDAIPNPDFTGSWSTAVVSSAPPTGQAAPPPVPDLWAAVGAIVDRADRGALGGSSV